jgi:hypothetical protein
MLLAGRNEMTNPEIERFFNQIPIWMERDIFREIQLARLSADPRTKPQMLAWRSEEGFIEFFDGMEDGRYKAWRLAWEASHPTTTLYESLRCGLVQRTRRRSHDTPGGT